MRAAKASSRSALPPRMSLLKAAEPDDRGVRQGGLVARRNSTRQPTFRRALADFEGFPPSLYQTSTPVFKGFRRTPRVNFSTRHPRGNRSMFPAVPATPSARPPCALHARRAAARARRGTMSFVERTPREAAAHPAHRADDPADHSRAGGGRRGAHGGRRRAQALAALGARALVATEGGPACVGELQAKGRHLGALSPPPTKNPLSMLPATCAASRSYALDEGCVADPRPLSGPALVGARRGAGPVAALGHDLSRLLPEPHRAEASLQLRDGAGRHRHRQFPLHRRADRRPLSGGRAAPAGDPPRHRSRGLRPLGGRARAHRGAAGGMGRRPLTSAWCCSPPG